MGKSPFPARRTGFRKPKKFFIVATEGAKTEKLYLDQFRPPREAVIQVKVLPNTKHKTRPKEVLTRLKVYASENNLGPEDELWLMIDRDNWYLEELDQVAAEIAKHANYFLAISNPCIELWFYLHLADNRFFNHGHQIIPELQRLLGGYDKADFDAERLASLVSDAIARAEKLDTPPQDPWPHSQGTHVYRLMKKIVSLSTGDS